MKINIRKSAIKDLKKINQIDKKRIHNKILEFENFPNISNLKRLTNFEPAYRARVGNYRILFDIVDDNNIEVARILLRKDSYKKT